MTTTLMDATRRLARRVFAIERSAAASWPACSLISCGWLSDEVYQVQVSPHGNLLLPFLQFSLWLRSSR